MSRRRKLIGLVVLAVAGGAVYAVLGGEGERREPRPVALRSQDFDVNPGWHAQNNRRLGRCTTTRQDFGSRDGAGSVGGLITRSARRAWYGRAVDLDFERPFTAAGDLVVHGTPAEPFPSGSVIVGFFNRANRDWRPPNLLAFQVNADTVPGGDYSISLAYGARNYQQGHVAYGGDDDPAGFRFGRRYRWRLSYDPDAEGGRGRATLAIVGAGPAARLVLAPDARDAGAVLDRFGVSNQVTTRGEPVEFDVGQLELDGVAQRRGSGAGDWRGEGNRVSFRDCLTGQPNSFGWTGPDDRRMGGLVARTDEDDSHLRAFYADRVGRLTLEDRLHAEGTVQLDRANSDSAALLGWFRAGTSGGGKAEAAPPDFVGISISGPSRVGQYFKALVADRKGDLASEDQAGILFNPSSRTLRWSFDYDPQGPRGGLITVGLGEQRRSFKVPRKLRQAGALLNRFGLRNLERGGSFQVVFFDDLRYSVSPRRVRAAAT